MAKGNSQLTRLDRLLTVFFFSPLVGLFRQSGDLKISILMYHSIASDIDDHVHPYFRTVTTPEIFKSHMEFLYQSGYEVFPLSKAVRLLQDVSDPLVQQTLLVRESLNSPKSPHPPRRPVVITFDDGFRDFYTTAFPILERFGLSATVFLTSGYLGKTFLTGRECLRVKEARELAEKGIEFGSHTVSHPQLSTLSRTGVEKELVESKKVIEAEVGGTVDSFSYPYRFPEDNDRFRVMLKEIMAYAGYKCGVTTVIGSASMRSDPLFMPRLPVNSSDDLQLFQAKLQGCYDWLHLPQYAIKKVKTTIGLGR